MVNPSSVPRVGRAKVVKWGRRTIFVAVATLITWAGDGVATGSTPAPTVSYDTKGISERKGKKKPLPNGAFRASGGLQKVRDGKKVVLCGRASKDANSAGGQWRAVRMVKKVKAPNPSWVITFPNLASNLERKAKTLRGPGSAKKAAKIRKGINRLLKKGREFDKVCRRKIRPGAAVLRGDVKDALGVALGKGNYGNTDGLYTIRRKGSGRSSDDLEIVQALTYYGTDYSGNDFEQVAQVTEVEEGPKPFLYVAMQMNYSGGVSIDPRSACRLAIVNRDTNQVSCLEREAWQGNTPSLAYSSNSLQTDSSGRLYYMTWLQTQNTISTQMWRYDPKSGEKVEVISGGLPSQVTISQWLVLGGGGVILSGYTSAGPGQPSSVPWLRWVSSNGQNEKTLATTYQGSPMRFFPDGNVYFVDESSRFAFGGGSSLRRVMVGNAASDGAAEPRLDERPWIDWSETPTGDPYFTRGDLCPEPETRWGLPPGTQWPGCLEIESLSMFEYMGGRPVGFYQGGGRVYALGRHSDRSELELFKVFGPESDARRAEAIWTRDKLASISGFTVESGQLVIYGPDRNDGVLTHIVIQDPTGTGQEIVSGGLGEFDVSSIGSLGNGQAVFSGWQSSTNRYVLGVVDVQGKTARVTEEIEKPMSAIIPLN